MKQRISAILFVIALLSVLTIQYSELSASPKREMRAAWIATVWALDWPTRPNGSWTTDPSEQKQLLINMLDSLRAMNMNCIALQGRTMSDAWYNSKYEPWSQWITGTRGGVPQYDPMEFAVTEAHKRGIEVHVWLNPYRYSSSSTQYNTNKALTNDYANTHPEWLMTVGDATILNPGLPEVKTRIAAVVADILEKYDVDGILFDDYFYLSGTTAAADAALYQANNPDGLSQADWRREQVNEMVRRVQDTIMHTKPWVTFGIGPAPQVAYSKAHADKYGVPQGPFNDWQYNSIYSDPLAWMSRRTIDYISPQMYWHIGSSTCDFAKLSEWWSMIAEKYGRHFYASHQVTDAKAAETAKEVQKLRNDDRIDADGSVLYDIHAAIYGGTNYVRNMRNAVWTAPVLPPQKWWRRQQEQLFVTNIRYTSGAYTWTPPATNSNVRYAVYYLPNDSIGKPNQFYDSRWLLGVTYEPKWTMNVKSRWTIAVAVLDRYGNEYAPRTDSGNLGTSAATTLVYPKAGVNPLLPAYFTWEAVAGADSYFVEIATDEQFTDIIGWHETGENRFYTGTKKNIEEGKTYWWRVLTRSLNKQDTWSAAASFTGNEFTMQSPKDGEKDVPIRATLVCDSVHAANVRYTFEVATQNTFLSNVLMFRGSADVPHITLPDSLLASYTRYYVRATAEYDGVTVRCNTISFTTVHIPAPKPVILSPKDGDILEATDVAVAWQPQAAKGFRVELSTLESFAPRMTKGLTTDAYTYTTTFTAVEEGEYYLRVRASDEGGYVNSDTLRISVRTPVSGVEDMKHPETSAKKYLIDGQVMIQRPDGKTYNLLGVPLEDKNMKK